MKIPSPSILPVPRAARRIMGRMVRRVTKPAGAPPGTLIHTGPQKVEEVRIRCLRYDGTHLEERSADRIEELLPQPGSPGVTWINVDGLHDVSVLEALEERFGFHRLVLEDVLSVNQRPKTEEYGDYFFVVVKMLSFDPLAKILEDEQVSLIVGDGYLISFQERPGDVWEPVRERLRQSKGRIRLRGADYLAYALVDAVVDGYFGVLEQLGDEIEDLEEKALVDGGTGTVHEIHALRRELLILRRAVWPLRDALGPMFRGDMERIHEETRIFLRDVHDHAVQVIDTVESLREVLAASMDLHLSAVSNRMNEVMKVLTIIATIFIPLSFFTGLYGMNFEHMPELSIPWAYPALLVFLASIAGGMLLFFKRKGWF